LGALAFEHVGGLAPCPLCLEQRYAYYAGIPVLLAALVLIRDMPRIAALLFVLVALAFLANAGLGVYHAGAEWKFWPGPDTCGTAQELPKSAGDLLADAEKTVVIRCDEAAIRIFGLSLAGWNVLASLLACAGAIKAALSAMVAR
jgi:disulfide bond formation protein DsbB